VRVRDESRKERRDDMASCQLQDGREERQFQIDHKVDRCLMDGETEKSAEVKGETQRTRVGESLSHLKFSQ
jgi:hypothetical protein